MGKRLWSIWLCCALGCTGAVGVDRDDPSPEAPPPPAAPGPKPAPGAPGAPSAGAPAPPPPGACAGPAAEGRLRRLTRHELANTLRDLFGESPALTDALELEPQIGAFYNSYADLWVDKSFLDRFLPIAQAVAGRAAARLADLQPCAWEGAGELGCVDRLIEGLGERLFREPVTADRRRKLTALWTRLRATPASIEESAQGLLQAMLLAPEFLYRAETLVGAEAEAGERGLRAQYQRASQLSYLLTASAPDAELLGAARAGRLRTLQEVEAQVRRLLAARSKAAGLLSFFEQLTEVPKYEFMEKDAKVHPDFDGALVADMQSELRAFVTDTLATAGTLDALLTASESFLTPRLARVYGVSGAVEPGRRTPLPTGQRAGLLTQAGLLAHLSPKAGTKPVARGHFVMRTLLCTDLTPPPEAQETLGQEVATAEMTTRQRFELHTTRPACASCHKLLDPIGFGLENYDALGRWRTKEGTRDVDARGVLAGTGSQDGPFSGGVELAKKLAASERLHACFATQFYRYALGRKETDADACALDAVTRRFASGGRRMDDLVLATVLSDAFLARHRPERK